MVTRSVSAFSLDFFFYRLSAWHQEDKFLREQYPIYADSDSAFAVLSTMDEMEVKQRTEEQIKARVKKLRLTAVSRRQRTETSSTDEADEAGDSDTDTGKGGRRSSDEEDAAGDVAPASPVHVRKIDPKSQPQSDDDSEGLFSSAEVGILAAVGRVFVGENPPAMTLFLRLSCVLVCCRQILSWVEASKQ